MSLYPHKIKTMAPMFLSQATASAISLVRLGKTIVGLDMPQVMKFG